MKSAFRFASAVAWLVGCAGAADVSTTSTTSAVVTPGSVVGSEQAIEELVRAQCKRAQACGASTAPGVYYGADYCSTNIEPATRDDLTGACPVVDSSRLAVCLDSVARAPCAMLNETVRAPWPCRRGALCGP